MKFRALGLAIVLVTLANQAWAETRVAIMDFSTDDNSYRSMQVAADFTSLLRAQLANVTGVAWVERAQLDVARQELELSDMENMRGTASMRLGKWAKADWMITGQFSSDDRNQRTLFLEITDLQHADVLASRTVVFPGTITPQFNLATNQLEIAGEALRELLSKARLRQQQTAGKILVAPLFLADVTGWGFSRNNTLLEQGFNEALEHAAATNHHVQLIHFPKAYRSTEESEMVLDGLVEANHNVWQQTAGLYVWGTYAITNKTIPGKPSVGKLEIALHVWDGSLKPVLIKEELPYDFLKGTPPDELATTLNRLACRTLSLAHKSTNQTDTASIRAEISKSLVDTYDRMTLRFHHRENLGLDDPAKFLQAVHMLETACFFDPDNAKARVLYITCRWGWWMDFSFKVKNEFWSKWRRSEAWGKYVNRFGLKPAPVELPFPYQQQGGVRAVYVRSLEEVLGMFPEWNSPEEMKLEDQWKQQGVHTSLVEAESHGFPKDMPHELAWKWKQEVQAELARRKKQVEEFSKTIATATNQPGKLMASVPTGAQPTSNPIQAKTLVKRIQPSSAEQNSRQMVPAPDWLKNLHGNSSMFQLSPPNALTPEVNPALEEIRFPNQFEVQSVLQLDRWQDNLFILAMDERSAQTSEDNPDVSAELLNKRNRLWTLKPGATRPVLYQPELFSQKVQRFLVHDNHLWIAGKMTGYLDLENNSFHQYGLDDGLPMQETLGIGFANETLFTCGNSFNAFRLSPTSNHWIELPKQTGSRSWSEGDPFILKGSGDRWLYFAQKNSSAFVYDLASNVWQNLSDQGPSQCSAGAKDGFWFGGRGGLSFYDPAGKTFTSWPAPGAIPGMRNVLMGSSYTGNSTMMRRNLENLEQQFQEAIQSVQQEHDKVRHNRLTDKKSVDPFHLNWRMPGDITAVYAEGDFLWLATEYNVLLLHLPDKSIMANYRLPMRDWATSLLIDKTSVWIGTAYGNHKLIRLSKDAFTSVPQSRWMSLAISSEDRELLIKKMSVRDQAVYAFYAGDDTKVVRLLENLASQKASLEEMFLLLFSYDTLGVDDPERMRAWSECINKRFPDSPWAKAASAAVSQNDRNHKVKQHNDALLASYDLNHDGVLDAREKKAMQNDPTYQKKQAVWNDDQLNLQLHDILSSFDVNKNGKLERTELEALVARVKLYSQAPPEMLKGHKILVAPLLSKDFPSASTILKNDDADRDGCLNFNELSRLAHDTQKE